MDGLLLDSEPLYRATWKAAASSLGFPIDDVLYERFVGRGNAESEQILSDHFGEMFPLDKFHSLWSHDFDESVSTVARKPGAMELLDALEKRGIPKALATSSPRVLALRCLGDLASRFAALAFGDEVSHAKPAPDLFLLAAHRLDVEDSEAGVRAAFAAGMDVIMVPDLVPPSEEIASITTSVCKTLHDVLAILEA